MFAKLIINKIITSYVSTINSRYISDKYNVNNVFVFVCVGVNMYTQPLLSPIARSDDHE